MKYLNILWMLVGVAALTTACSDDDERFPLNTTGATVQFNKTSVTLKESVKYVDLPIEITGLERDGFINVKVDVKSNPSNFDLNSEVVVTSFDFVVPADRQSINLEVGLHVETLNMDRGRNISFEITKVEGASLGGNTACTINIVEQNAAEGIYAIKGVSPFDSEQASGLCNITVEDESFDKMYIDLGFGNKGRVIFTEIVPDTEYDIAIQPFQSMGKYKADDGVTYDVYLSWAKYNSATKKLDPDRNATIKGKFLRTHTDGVETVKITMEDGFGFGHLSADDEFEWFLYDCFKPGAVMTKIQ